MSYHIKREHKRSTESLGPEEEAENGPTANSKSPPPSGDTPESGGSSPKEKSTMEHDKRLRREIANSNERRRMQSINSGFESLKTLIPHTDGEKLSKAAILHHTSDYITALESEKTRLLSQNAKLKREMLELGTTRESPRADTESDLGSSQGSPPPKRKKRDTESSDEGIGMSSGDFDEPTMDELKREMIYLRSQLDRERRLRMMLEDQTRTLESQLYPERLRQIASQVQAQMRYQEEKQKYLAEQRRLQQEQEEALAARSASMGAPIVIAPTSNPITTPVPAPQTTSPPPPVAKRPPLPPTISSNSMSRRNLETIVEAIRHLEGDNILFDGVQKGAAASMPRDTKSSSSSSSSSSNLMETDSVYGSSAGTVSSSSENEEDEGRESGSSGRDSPQSKMDTSSKMADASSLLALRARDAASAMSSSPASPSATHHHHQIPHHQIHRHHTHHLQLQVNSDRFPIASQLLKKEQLSPPLAHRQPYLPRPAVIVQNLS